MPEQTLDIRRILVLSVMVGVMMGLLLLVFSAFEDSLGHAIAIASFAATTVSVFMHSKVRANKPLAIALCYMGAAVIGYAASLLPAPLFVQAGVALFVLALGFLLLDSMHPPAVAYALGFLLGGYGMLEVALTVPALFVYFITMGVVILVVERLATWMGLLPYLEPDQPARSWYEWCEQRTHALVPYALVLLFASIMTEFLYPELVEPYALYLRLLDTGVITLFIVDLAFIYRRSSSINVFVRQNWIDIIAAIPFFIVFRMFQGAALAFSLVARGAAETVTEAGRFSRFARPVARTPRFMRLLDRLDEVGL